MPRRTARPRLLDLYCGEGGAGMGYYRAGWDVFGVDLNDDHRDRKTRPRPKPLRRYPFPCVEADAFGFLLDGGWRGFDAIHASPPCQAWSPITRITGAKAHHVDLIGPTRQLLEETGLPYVIENVERAPLAAGSVLLCGSMFDPPLDVRRHRLFEANWALEPPQWPCRHKLWTPRFQPADSRERRAGKLLRVVPVYGSTRVAGDAALRCRAMEIEWMSRAGICEAIPPRYTEFVGAQLLSLVIDEVAA
jgi:DNA (cytosine-5)-methyltransferase 1